MGYAKVDLSELSVQETEMALKYLKSININMYNGAAPSYLIIALRGGLFSEELQYLGDSLISNLQKFLIYNGFNKVLLLYKASSAYHLYNITLKGMTILKKLQDFVNIDADEFKNIHEENEDISYQTFTAPNGVKLSIETHSKKCLEIKHNKESILLLNN